MNVLGSFDLQLINCNDKKIIIRYRNVKVLVFMIQSANFSIKYCPLKLRPIQYYTKLAINAKNISREYQHFFIAFFVLLYVPVAAMSNLINEVEARIKNDTQFPIGNCFVWHY